MAGNYRRLDPHQVLSRNCHFHRHSPSPPIRRKILSPDSKHTTNLLTDCNAHQSGDEEMPAESFQPRPVWAGIGCPSTPLYFLLHTLSAKHCLLLGEGEKLHYHKPPIRVLPQQADVFSLQELLMEAWFSPWSACLFFLQQKVAEKRFGKGILPTEFCTGGLHILRAFCYGKDSKLVSRPLSNLTEKDRFLLFWNHILTLRYSEIFWDIFSSDFLRKIPERLIREQLHP